MVSKPEQFDVIVTSNLYGNVLGNIAAGLIGSPGLVPGYNIGNDYVVFEPGVRHVARDIEGLNAANPVAMLLSSAYLLQYLGLVKEAQNLRNSVTRVFNEGKVKN
jgi:isocitrate dehydrogenase (NAD+)